MTLNANQPTDQCLVSELPAYIRASRAAINSIVGEDVNLTTNNLTIATGTTALTIGTDLGAVSIELILTSGLGASAIAQIRGGTEGQIKIFITQSNTISFVDGVDSDGRLYLNQLPVLSTFNAQEGDVLALVNIGGNGGANYGYWKELWRQLAVK